MSPEFRESFSPTASPQLPGGDTMTHIPEQPAYLGGGTLTPDFGAQVHEQPPRGGPAAAHTARRIPPLALPKDQAEKATARLEHVCHLLRRERSPLCPVNGLLTVLPFEIIARGDPEASEVHNSVRSDLATLRTGLRVRSQVIALCGGMEREAGFPELKRRLGPKVANDQQFGKGYNPHCPSIDEELAAVAQHACGAFEDWTYHLFAQKSERLSNPRGNRQLYALVCKIRSLQQRIENVIVKGFAANGDSAEKPHLFSGCYFAATGDRDDRRAFVAGVFKNRLLAQDEDVEWTSDALAENDWYQLSANLLVALDVLLIGVIITAIVIGFNQG
jgi:type VI protein secretion system component VasK